MRMQYIRFTPYESVYLGCISKLAAEIWKEIEDAMGNRKLTSKRRALDCLLLHLFLAESVGVRRKKAAFYPEGVTKEIRGKYYPTWFTPTIVLTVLDALDDVGLIRHEVGRKYRWNHPKRVAKGIKAESTKIYPAGKLRAALSDIHSGKAGVNPSDPSERPCGKRKEVIEVVEYTKKENVVGGKVRKVKVRKLKGYRDTPETKRMRTKLEGINEFLSSAVVTLPSTPISDGFPKGYILNNINNTLEGGHLEHSEGKAQHHMRTLSLQPTGNKSDAKHGHGKRLLCDYTMIIPARVKHLGVNRIYCPAIQSLSKKDRKMIRINGEETVELDYEATHPMLMYALKGIQYEEDPYSAVTAKIKDSVDKEVFESLRPLVASLEGEGDGRDRKGGIMRRLVKSCFSMLLNAKSGGGAASAWRDEATAAMEGDDPGTCFNTHDMMVIAEKLGGLAVVFRAIRDTHPEISHMLCGDKGVELMATDAAIALSVMGAMTAAGVPCLSIHDSFIAPASKEAMLRGHMAAAWSYHTGRKGLTCPVS